MSRDNYIELDGVILGVDGFELLLTTLDSDTRSIENGGPNKPSYDRPGYYCEDCGQKVYDDGEAPDDMSVVKDWVKDRRYFMALVKKLHARLKELDNEETKATEEA